ncbi:hypothetical protein V5O48_000209 [Marasmius crinis-equi]|uniref:DRBM domain-containing protein n=1 Tax=Marasmius crinis-equi TaxID=585013 RepID=A0ABR3FY72_9AGAR
MRDAGTRNRGATVEDDWDTWTGESESKLHRMRESYFVEQSMWSWISGESSLNEFLLTRVDGYDFIGNTRGLVKVTGGFEAAEGGEVRKAKQSRIASTEALHNALQSPNGPTVNGKTVRPLSNP